MYVWQESKASTGIHGSKDVNGVGYKTFGVGGIGYNDKQLFELADKRARQVIGSKNSYWRQYPEIIPSSAIPMITFRMTTYW